MDEGRQFAVLHRSFLLRVIDLELLAATGDIRNLMAQVAALLAAYSFVLVYAVSSNFRHASGGHAKLLVRAWSIEEFLISTTITVAGLFMVLAWNAILPDRKDALILDPLPVRNRVVLSAKVGAIGTVLGIAVAAVNLFTGLAFPFLIAAEGAGLFAPMRSLCAYWGTMAAAGVFVCAAIFALQNAMALAGFAFFQRVSGLMQILAFCWILRLFFVTPALANPGALSLPQNQPLLAWLPSYWFLGLFHVLNGDRYSFFEPLAMRAVWMTAVPTGLAILTAGLSYRRTVRRMVEQPDVLAHETGRLSRAFSELTRRTISNSIDRATLLFSVRTLMRSRQHRLVLAVYLGIALALSFAYAKALLSGTEPMDWERPNVALLNTSLVILFFAVIGTRAVFALPFALAANWIFRTTAVRRAALYFSAVRKTLFVVAALPVVSISTVLYLSLWPGLAALEHLLVLMVLSSLLVEISLRKFRKLPFACSYLPGKANLRLKFGFGLMTLLFAVDLGANIEHWSMEKPARYAVMMGLMMTGAVWATKRTAEFGGSPYNQVQFEDKAPSEIYALDLRRDSDYVNDGDYLDAVSEPTPHSVVDRLKMAAVGAALLVLAGFGYESFGEWRDLHKYSQIGRRVDVGGRALNLYCAGVGTPTVVMDSGGGMPGYAWSLVEPGAAKLTRACWYDRAGYGWSDATPSARSAEDIAVDLRRLLHAAGVLPPYVLVGHSVGGFNVRVFAAKFSSEVAGMVLVDSADEYEDGSQLPKSMQSPLSGLMPRPLKIVAGTFYRFGVHAGLMRLFDSGQVGRDGGLSERDSSMMQALRMQAKAFDASYFEGLGREETLAQVKAVRSLGSLPLIVLSGAKEPDVTLDADDEILLKRFMNHRVHVTQAHLATLSTRGRQIVLADVGHAIPTEAPQAVVAAIGEVLSLQ